MKIIRLSISNFRGIKSAELHFDGHTLFVGPNNIGKSTICDALDLVLGPDRLSRVPPVEEFDFYNAKYLGDPKDEAIERAPVVIRIEVILTELTAEVENRCGAHVEFWNAAEKKVLDRGDVEAANPPNSVSCLRLETLAKYNPEEDEFEAETYFSHSPDAPPGDLTPVRKNIKRLFGFLYLRAHRTGSRALSLERGSLLDLILRVKEVRTGLWEKAIGRLRALAIEDDATEIQPVLKALEKRLTQYIPSNADGRATKLHVSQLTREHLRKTMSFFLAMSKDQAHVPFQQVGTGTLNTLVLALLSFIADLKPDTVIFAMEEPEIALPPHTQRRIADYLQQKTTQAFVTSHSPYVIERFEPHQTLLLTRSDAGHVGALQISDGSSLSDYDYKRYARRGLTECMLGKGALVVEGITEFHALPVIARKMEEANKDLQPLDLAGVALFDAESDGPMPKFGAFFKNLGLKTIAFYDHKNNRPPQEQQKFAVTFDINCQHQYSGFEALIASEVPVQKLWEFLAGLLATGENGNVGIPLQRPNDDEVKRITKEALRSNKGTGWAARLLESCALNELPATVTQFLTSVYALFPKPPEVDDEALESAPSGADGQAQSTPETPLVAPTR